MRKPVSYALGLMIAFSQAGPQAGPASAADVTMVNIVAPKAAALPQQVSPAMAVSSGGVRILSLENCVDIAVKNHLPLKVAEKNIRVAKMRVFEARRNMLPTASARWEESNGKVNGRRYYGKKAYIEGQQTIFHGGELYYTMKQAETNLEVVKNDYGRIRNDLVLQVKKAYYTLAKSQENLRIQQGLAIEVAKVDEMAKKQFDAGILPKLELLNVGSQASQVRFQLASAQGDVGVADLILKQSMYMDADEKIDIAPKLAIKKLAINFADVLATALKNRSEIKVNTYMVEYYRLEKKISNAKGWWPKIDLLGSWGLAKEEFTAKDNQGIFNAVTGGIDKDKDEKMEQQWYAGFKMSVPFWGSTGEYSYTKEQWTPVVSAFHGTNAATSTLKVNLLDNLKSLSEIQGADVDYDRARQELAKAENDITLDVRESHFSFEKALLQMETATNKVAYQEKDLEASKVKRSMDEAQDSNVVDSMVKLAQEKFGLIQALTDYHIAVASLNKALGIEDYFASNG